MTRKAHLKSSRHSVKSLCPLLYLVLICFLFSLPVSAQVFDTGTIGGLVTDPSGAVVPQATVTITNVGTGIQRTLQTDNGGSFVASALPFGSYVVSATASAFGTATSKPIVLNVGATVQVNLGLTVTATLAKIEVTGTSTTIDTPSPATRTTLHS